MFIKCLVDICNISKERGSWSWIAKRIISPFPTVKKNVFIVYLMWKVCLFVHGVVLGDMDILNILKPQHWADMDNSSSRGLKISVFT